MQILVIFPPYLKIVDLFNSSFKDLFVQRSKDKHSLLNNIYISNYEIVSTTPSHEYQA